MRGPRDVLHEGDRVLYRAACVVKATRRQAARVGTFAAYALAKRLDEQLRVMWDLHHQLHLSVVSHTAYTSRNALLGHVTAPVDTSRLERQLDALREEGASIVAAARALGVHPA